MLLLKRAFARLPRSWQLFFARKKTAWELRIGRFVPIEPEMDFSLRCLRQGDLAIDVGANVGHYTIHLARCVGSSGLVLAVEPVPETLRLLIANVHAAGLENVRFLNVAASDSARLAAISVPKSDETGLANLYRASLVEESETQVLCIALDSLEITDRVRLVKVDAEGHDLEVLKGMRNLLLRHRPFLIVESPLSGPIPEFLASLNYSVARLADSPNIVAQPAEIGEFSLS